MGLRFRYTVNVLLLVSFLTLFTTGLLKHPLVFRQLSELSLPMAQLSFVHDWSGVLMGILGIVHLILHWRWYTSMTRRMVKGE